VSKNRILIWLPLDTLKKGYWVQGSAVGVAGFDPFGSNLVGLFHLQIMTTGEQSQLQREFELTSQVARTG